MRQDNMNGYTEITKTETDPLGLQIKSSSDVERYITMFKMFKVIKDI